MIKSWQAFLISIGSIISGFVVTIFYPAAPYSTFCTAIGVVFAAYVGKRLWQKRTAYEQND